MSGSTSGFGGGSTPSGYTTTTSTNTPWGPTGDGLQNVYNRANDLFTGPQPQYYPNNPVAGLNQYQTSAGNALGNLGLSGGSGALQAAQGNSQATLNGNYLSAGNPYFQGMVGQIAQSVQPQVDSQFEASGRYGSGAAANAFASALTNQAGQLAYQNYDNERNNQIKAQALAPAIDQQQAGDLQGAIGAGQMFQSQDQNQINADQQRWNYNQNLPYQTLGKYAQYFPTGAMSQSTSTSTPYFEPSGVSTSLGIASAGLGLVNSLFGSGSGASYTGGLQRAGSALLGLLG